MDKIDEYVSQLEMICENLDKNNEIKVQSLFIEFNNLKKRLKRKIPKYLKCSKNLTKKKKLDNSNLMYDLELILNIKKALIRKNNPLWARSKIGYIYIQLLFPTLESKKEVEQSNMNKIEQLVVENINIIDSKLNTQRLLEAFKETKIFDNFLESENNAAPTIWYNAKTMQDVKYLKAFDVFALKLMHLNGKLSREEYERAESNLTYVMGIFAGCDIRDFYRTYVDDCTQNTYKVEKMVFDWFSKFEYYFS